MEKTRDSNSNTELKSHEMQILKLIRELEYGQLVISVKNGKPVHVEARKSIVLNP